MEYVYYAIDLTNQELYHHGILGQKWGVRRYQNNDGTWTDEGLKRRRSSLGERLSIRGIKSASHRSVDAGFASEKYHNKRINANISAEKYKTAAARNDADYRLAKSNKEKYQNKLSTKLIGSSDYTLRKYDKAMDKAKRAFNENEAMQKNHEANAMAYKQKEEAAAAKQEKLLNLYYKRIDKHIAKYGNESLDELGIKPKSRNDSKSSPKAPTSFKSMEEYENAVNKATADSDKALNMFENYMKKNNMFQPDEDGPVYKSEKDFWDGKVDEKGTKLWDNYEQKARYLDDVENADWDF